MSPAEPTLKGLLTLVWIVCACFGCGKAEYDQLVQKRIADLRSGRFAAPKWQPFTSERFSYGCELPAAPKVTPTDVDQVESEKVDAAVGATAYQVVFVRGNPQQLEEAAATIQQQFESSGFQVEGDREDANVGGYSAVRFRFVVNETGQAARVQVFVLSDNRSCAMSVVGAELKDADVARFFDSFAEG